MELTILMPCLNEAETLATCIRKARRSLEELGIVGEVVIADNGSTDGSQDIATREGARVVNVPRRGYGSALLAGSEAALGKYIIMGDADDSYDFSNIGGFVERLRAGYDLVMGCRMPRGGGTVMPGAMPWKHRWLGNPVLSFIGRLFFKCPANDFHCGLRGYTKAAFHAMELRTTGMEFASEMVIKATLKGLKITEVPITLYKDGRSRPPHLRSWRDGWRHLRFMLLYSPRWLFLVPGLLLALLGGLGVMVLFFGVVSIGGVKLDVGTMAGSAMALLAGVQLVAFALFTKVFAIAEGLLPDDRRLNRLFRWLSLESGAVLGLLLCIAGLAVLVSAVLSWRAHHFGDLSYSENLRRVIGGGTLLTLGVQVVFSSFFLSVLGLRTETRRPPGEVN